MSKQEDDFDYSNMITLTKNMIEDFLYFQSEGPLKAVFDEGNKDLVLVTGENATGKSFIRRLYYGVIALKKYEVIHLSQQGRSTSGIMKAFVYGDETYNSTGSNTANTIITGISTCQSRDNPHYIIWDEPDIGLSEKYAGGAGVAIREFVKNLPKLTKGVVVITHSKALVRQLLPIKPSHLRLGGCPDINEWVNRVEEPGDLNELGKRNHETFRNIQSIINGIKE